MQHIAILPVVFSAAVLPIVVEIVVVFHPVSYTHLTLPTIYSV